MTTRYMAHPKRRPSILPRLLGVGVSAGMFYLALHAFAMATQGGFLFSLLFLVLGGISLNLSVRDVR